MEEPFVVISVLFFCIIFLSSLTAVGSFEYYSLKRKITNEAIQDLLNDLKSPLSDLYNVTDRSLFATIHSVTILEFTRSGDIPSALFVRCFSSIWSLTLISFSVIGVFQTDSFLQKIVAILIILLEIFVWIKAWRFGSKLGH